MTHEHPQNCSILVTKFIEPTDQEPNSYFLFNHIHKQTNKSRTTQMLDSQTKYKHSTGYGDASQMVALLAFNNKAEIISYNSQ